MSPTLFALAALFRDHFVAKFNPNHHPQGAPDGKGGEFAPKDGALLPNGVFTPFSGGSSKTAQALNKKLQQVVEAFSAGTPAQVKAALDAITPYKDSNHPVAKKFNAFYHDAVGLAKDMVAGGKQIPPPAAPMVAAEPYVAETPRVVTAVTAHAAKDLSQELTVPSPPGYDDQTLGTHDAFVEGLFGAYKAGTLEKYMAAQQAHLPTHLKPFAAQLLQEYQSGHGVPSLGLASPPKPKTVPVAGWKPTGVMAYASSKGKTPEQVLHSLIVDAQQLKLTWEAAKKKGDKDALGEAYTNWMNALDDINALKADMASGKAYAPQVPAPETPTLEMNLGYHADKSFTAAEKHFLKLTVDSIKNGTVEAAVATLESHLNFAPNTGIGPKVVGALEAMRDGLLAHAVEVHVGEMEQKGFSLDMLPALHSEDDQLATAKIAAAAVQLSPNAAYDYIAGLKLGGTAAPVQAFREHVLGQLENAIMGNPPSGKKVQSGDLPTFNDPDPTWQEHADNMLQLAGDIKSGRGPETQDLAEYGDDFPEGFPDELHAYKNELLVAIGQKKVANKNPTPLGEAFDDDEHDAEGGLPTWQAGMPAANDDDYAMDDDEAIEWHELSTSSSHPPEVFGVVLSMQPVSPGGSKFKNDVLLHLTQTGLVPKHMLSMPTPPFELDANDYDSIVKAMSEADPKVAMQKLKELGVGGLESPHSQKYLDSVGAELESHIKSIKSQTTPVSDKVPKLPKLPDADQLPAGADEHEYWSGVKDVIEAAPSLSAQLQLVAESMADVTPDMAANPGVHWLQSVQNKLLGANGTDLGADDVNAPAFQPTGRLPKAPYMPGTHGIAKWNNKTVDDLVTAAQSDNPIAAIANVSLSEKHHVTVKEFKKKLLAYYGQAGYVESYTPAKKPTPKPKKVPPMPAGPHLGAMGTSHLSALTMMQEAYKTGDVQTIQDTPINSNLGGYWAVANYKAELLDTLKAAGFKPGKPLTQVTEQNASSVAQTAAASVKAGVKAKTPPKPPLPTPPQIDPKYPEDAQKVFQQKVQQYIAAYHSDDPLEALSHITSNSKTLSQYKGLLEHTIIEWKDHMPVAPASVGAMVSKLLVIADHVAKPVPPMPKRAHTEFNQYAYKYRNKLPNDQKQAVSSYQGSGYKNINDSLRANPDMKSSAILALDKALAGSVVDRDTFIYRNIDSSTLAGLAPGFVGKVIEDPAFMSTSLNGSFGSYSNVSLRLNVPKGSRGLYLNSQQSDGSYEHEILLPRRTRWKVHKVEKVMEGHITKTLIHGELLPPSDQPSIPYADTIAQIWPHQI